MEQPNSTQLYPSVRIRLKVVLQACYDPATDRMHTELHQKGAVPASQPYGCAPWHYGGGETMNTTDPSIVDWVLVELYAGGFLRGQAAGLLRNDGSFVDGDGNAVVSIPVENFVASTAVSDVNPLPSDSYYLVVRHRNHLPVRSKYPLNFAAYNGEVIINLSFDAGNCFCNQEYTPTVQVGSTWCMRAGDVNSDGQVKANGAGNDQNALVNDPALNGLLSSVADNQYGSQDVNMDGVIKRNGPNNDLNFLLNEALGGSFSKVYKSQL